MPPVPPARRRGLPVLPALLTLCALAATSSAQTPPPGGGAAATEPAAAGAGKTGTGTRSASREKAATGAAGDKNAISYSVGVSMGEQMHNSGISADEINTERLAAGVRDALGGKAKLDSADKERIGKLLSEGRGNLGERNHRAAADFLAANGKKPDVVTTASGLEYKVLTPGSGASPTPTDKVTVHYRGTLPDGTEFDSSYKRGSPATFPVNGVIPGWTEALQLMKKGGKYQLWIPPQLAYDLNPPAAAIPPGSMLIFEVELVAINPPEAGGAPPAPAK